MRVMSFALACVCVAFAAPASAKQCPSGQILRVSKGVCVDKASAVKNGVVVAPAARVARLNDKQATSNDAQARGRTVVEKSGSSESARQNASMSPALGYAATAQDEPAPKPSVSPYGELRLDYFGVR